MTLQADKGASGVSKIAVDAPIFDPGAFRLKDEQAEIIARARELGRAVFAGRAAVYDRDARFPTENYADLHRAGFAATLVMAARRRGGA